MEYVFLFCQCDATAFWFHAYWDYYIFIFVMHFERLDRYIILSFDYAKRLFYIKDAQRVLRKYDRTLQLVRNQKGLILFLQ